MGACWRSVCCMCVYVYGMVYGGAVYAACHLSDRHVVTPGWESDGGNPDTDAGCGNGTAY